MTKKFLITSIILIILIVTLFVCGVVYYMLNNPFSPLNKNSQNPVNQSVVKTTTEKKQEVKKDPLAQVNEEFPDVLQGIITIAEKQTTLKTDDGKIYIFWPQQPKSVYEYLGIKNKQTVKVQGKISGENHLEWGVIKPI